MARQVPLIFSGVKMYTVLRFGLGDVLQSWE